MALNVAIQMDHIEAIDITGDSTFALGIESQDRGHRLYVYHPDSMSMTPGGTVMARGSWVTLRDTVGNHVMTSSLETIDLASFDVILMRQDPPFDMHYITATYMLEALQSKVLVVNDPRAVRNAPEKLVATLFPELMPPTMISREIEALRDFRHQYRDIILKPLYGNGGAGIFHLKQDDTNFAALLEMLLSYDRNPLMAQQYLPAVRQGDKRVILVDGEAVGALNRIPQADDARSNLHVGGTAAATTLDADDLRIAATVGPMLKEQGLVFCGIDVIGGYLTEINVTSPTGLREIENLGGENLAKKIWDSIESKL